MSCDLFYCPQGDNELTELLLKRLNSTGRVHMVPASLKGRYIIRFTVTSQYTTPGDIEEDWNVIRRTADQVIEDLVKEEQEEEEVIIVTTTKTNGDLGNHQNIGRVFL